MRWASASGRPAAAAWRCGCAPIIPRRSCNLGVALQGLGRQAEAVEQFRRALEVHPDFVDGPQQSGRRAARTSASPTRR